MSGLPSTDLVRSVRAELSALPRLFGETLPWLLRNKVGSQKTLVQVLRRNVQKNGSGLAVEMDEVRYTWQELDALTSRVAHVLAGHGVRRGDTVALVGANSPLYLAVVLGVARAGGKTALINHNLEGAPLSHALKAAKTSIAIVQDRFVERVNAREDLVEPIPTRLHYGEGGDFEAALMNAPAHAFEPVPLEPDDDFVYIYTSGTTGFPKPCRVSHARAVTAAAGFASMMYRFKPGDKVYCVLPLYHASALLLGVASCMISQVPIALRESFSASNFWSDVRRYDATAILYIGELLRYLNNSKPQAGERDHRVRVAVGNGLRPDVWEPFQERFGIPEIREFYAATEAPGFLINISGKPGSVGRMPFGGFGWMVLARFDVDEEQHVRDANGYCIRSAPDEVGELLVRLPEKLKLAATEFRGYTDEEATSKKILTDVFEKGDRYFRSGDLLRMDEEGFFYFVDRIGDTFRCKGENVSTAEVADVLGRADGVEEVTVVGVKVPPLDGQFGMAAVVPQEGFDPQVIVEASKELPSYARPRFIRILTELDHTGTFKVQKGRLKKEGADPDKCTDPLYVLDGGEYVAIEGDVKTRLQAGEVRL